MRNKINIERLELYNRALFSFTHQSFEVNVAFELYDKDIYMMIIFGEQHLNKEFYHNEELWEVLQDILLSFDDNRKLEYKVFPL